MANTNLEKELVDLEKRYWRAMKDGDIEAAIALTDFPCIVAGSHGVDTVDKAAFTRMMSSSKYKIREAELDDPIHVRMLGDDVAILAYRIHEELTIDDKPVTLDAADSSTWVRRDGRWVCAHHSESIMPNGPAAA